MIAVRVRGDCGSKTMQDTSDGTETLVKQQLSRSGQKVNLSNCVHAAQTNAATGMSFLLPEFLLLCTFLHHEEFVHFYFILFLLKLNGNLREPKRDGEC